MWINIVFRLASATPECSTHQLHWSTPAEWVEPQIWSQPVESSLHGAAGCLSRKLLHEQESQIVEVLKSVAAARKYGYQGNSQAPPCIYNIPYTSSCPNLVYLHTKAWLIHQSAFHEQLLLCRCYCQDLMPHCPRDFRSPAQQPPRLQEQLLRKSWQGFGHSTNQLTVQDAAFWTWTTEPIA